MKRLFRALGYLNVTLLFLGCTRREVTEQTPTTNNVFVKQQENKTIDKVDLLFVVDNSASMGDKQSIFEKAVPKMLERLIQPDCVKRDERGTIVGRQPSQKPESPALDPSCDAGYALEFSAVRDIHVGVISSSLGGHGGFYCSEANGNDGALLMPKVRPALAANDPHGTGFLVWHPDDDGTGPVEDDLERLKTNFRAHVLAAGEQGCGFEAPLEAWYRFLVDPTPPASVVKNGNQSEPQGIAEEILVQRRAFLRPDSLVAVVLLTDENDCSVMDGGALYDNAGLGWMVTAGQSPLPAGGNLPRSELFPIATSACAQNPNDPCCFSCFRDDAPSGCDDPTALSSCSAVGQPRLLPEQDRANTRCFDELGRFGVDLLYPVSRYVDGLTKPTVYSIFDGAEHPNPLLRGTDGLTPRSPGLIYFAGITGVAWQDISDTESLSDENRLRYLTAAELKSGSYPGQSNKTAQGNYWDLILGDPKKPAVSCEQGDNCGEAPIPPADPFMQESIFPRTGAHPFAGESITTTGWNNINGHEQDVSVAFDLVGGSDAFAANDDLQYSCIFPLLPYGGVKEDCSPDDSSCDCGRSPLRDRPLCKESPSSVASTTQYFGKAYPATRILSLMHDFGANSVVASICPKIHVDSEADFGFNPAIAAIVERLSEKLKGQCLPRPLALDESGRVPCEVVEVMQSEDIKLSCNAASGREPVSDKVQKAILQNLKSSRSCSDPNCSEVTMCTISQAAGADEEDACLNAPQGSELTQKPGYCYVAPSQGLGNPSLVSACKASERQLLRFVGPETPTPNASVFVACSGEFPEEVGISLPPTPDQ